MLHRAGGHPRAVVPDDQFNLISRACGSDAHTIARSGVFNRLAGVAGEVAENAEQMLWIHRRDGILGDVISERDRAFIREHGAAHIPHQTAQGDLAGLRRGFFGLAVFQS